jgi:hypothetical protein
MLFQKLKKSRVSECTIYILKLLYKSYNFSLLGDEPRRDPLMRENPTHNEGE